MNLKGKRQSQNVVDIRGSVRGAMYDSQKEKEENGVPARALTNKSLKDVRPSLDDDFNNILTVNQYRTMDSLNKPLLVKPGKISK